MSAPITAPRTKPASLVDTPKVEDATNGLENIATDSKPPETEPAPVKANPRSPSAVFTRAQLIMRDQLAIEFAKIIVAHQISVNKPDQEMAAQYAFRYANRMVFEREADISRTVIAISQAVKQPVVPNFEPPPGADPIQEVE